MFCPNCGTQNPETAPTCSKCGFQIRAQVAAAPKFKGTMLMMNQPGGAGAPPPRPGPAPGAPPLSAEPQSGTAPSFQAEAPPIGAGAPPAGGALGVPSRLKGTIVGVAPPNVGGAPMGAPPPEHHAFGSQQGVNPLGGTMAVDASALPSFGQAPGADPSAPPAFGGAPQPGFGAPPAGAGGYGGAPRQGGGFYGAPPPPQQDFAQQMNQGFNQVGQAFNQAGQQLDQAFNQGMQPYAGGAPMGQPGQPGMMVPPGEAKSWMVTLLLCIFAGGFGVHRFYVGKIGSGIAQVLTLGGCGIWALIDLVMILTGKFTDAQGRPLVKDS